MKDNPMRLAESEAVSRINVRGAKTRPRHASRRAPVTGGEGTGCAYAQRAVAPPEGQRTATTSTAVCRRGSIDPPVLARGDSDASQF